MNASASIPHARNTLLAAALALVVSACGGDKNPASGKDAANAAKPGTPATADDADAAPKTARPTLADGPDVCFRMISEQLGKDLKVSEITSFFSSGSEIDSSASKPAGEMTTCSVEYQSPDDPRKLVESSLDFDTGKFDAPKPMEITVMGNAADFRLEDYLIPLLQVNAAGLSAVMASQKSALDGVYSKYAWDDVRLEAPGPFDNKHTLRIGVEGRLAANDIKENGYASVTTDGKKISRNHLLP